MNTTDAGELAAELAVSFDAVGFHPRSATIYGSVAAGTADDDSDIDVLCVVDSMPAAGIHEKLDDLLDYRFEARANLSFMFIEEALSDAADSGSVLTWAIECGIPVSGAALHDLFPEAVSHDEVEAARRAHERSALRVRELQSRDASKVPRHGLYELLAKAANAALLHHGLGRFKTAGGRLQKSAAKLESLVGSEAAERAVELCSILENDISRASPEEVAEVSALVASMLERASEPGAPGATTL